MYKCLIAWLPLVVLRLLTLTDQSTVLPGGLDFHGRCLSLIATGHLTLNGLVLLVTTHVCMDLVWEASLPEIRSLGQ